jgi:alpha-tubulin suppressor-like RCC1 family protein
MRLPVLIPLLTWLAVGAGYSDAPVPTLPRTSLPQSDVSVQATSSPVPLASLSLGDAHACALTSAGRAYCWGAGNGALGAGPVSSSSNPVAVLQDTLRFRNITAGYNFTCALTAVGKAYCWGLNSWGQLGTGDYLARTTPAKVRGGLAFSDLEAGADYSCGLTLATNTTPAGKVYCWGKNDYAQLGDGNSEGISSAARPVAVKQGAVQFKRLSVGLWHGCAITVNNAASPAGKAYCWGRNDAAQLGVGVANLGYPYPVPVSQGALAFTDVSAGDVQTCALDAASKAHCWGASAHGEAGAENGILLHPTAVAQGGLSFRTLALASWISCALTRESIAGPANKAYCWGFNQFRQALGRSVLSLAAPQVARLHQALTAPQIALVNRAVRLVRSVLLDRNQER